MTTPPARPAMVTDALETVRQFFLDEYSDPACEVDGHFLAPEARKAWDALHEALAMHQVAMSGDVVERVARAIEAAYYGYEPAADWEPSDADLRVARAAIASLLGSRTEG